MIERKSADDLDFDAEVEAFPGSAGGVNGSFAVKSEV